MQLVSPKRVVEIFRAGGIVVSTRWVVQHHRELGGIMVGRRWVFFQEIMAELLLGKIQPPESMTTSPPATPTHTLNTPGVFTSGHARAFAEDSYPTPKQPAPPLLSSKGSMAERLRRELASASWEEPSNLSERTDAPRLTRYTAEEFNKHGGWDFDARALYKRIQADGVHIHASVSSFKYWINTHKPQIEEKSRQLKEWGGSEDGA